MNAKNSLRRDIFHENSCFCKNYKLDLVEILFIIITETGGNTWLIHW